MREPKIKMMIDSGAFSAWKTGKSVSLPEYCDFLHEHAAWIGNYVNLDVIASKDPDTSARESFANYKYMRSRGLNPIAVVHGNEDLDWFDRYLDLGADYLGMGAHMIGGNAENDAWYALAWNRLVTDDGLPIVKVHGFGEGRKPAMLAFPWYSVDTATWFHAAQATARIKVRENTTLAFRKDGASSKAALDISTLAGDDLDAFNKILDDAGLARDAFSDRADTKTGMTVRLYMMALYYHNIETHINTLTPIRHKQVGFFRSNNAASKAIDIPKFHLNLAMGCNPTICPPLTLAKHTNCLTSYFYIKRGYFLDQTIDFVYDPLASCTARPQVKQYYDALMEKMNDRK